MIIRVFAAVVGSHGVHKRVCWLRAKMAVANNKWRCHIQERDAGSVAGDGYRDAPFGRVGMLQARENEKLEWRQAVQNTMSGQPIQQVESRWFRDRKHRNQHNGSNGSATWLKSAGRDVRTTRGATRHCGGMIIVRKMKDGRVRKAVRESSKMKDCTYYER